MMRQGDTGDWIGTFEGHKGAVWGVALNPQASKAATGAADFNAKVSGVCHVAQLTGVWDAVSGEVLHSFQHNHIVKSVNFSSNSSLFVTGSNEKLIKIFDLNKPDAEPQVFSGHTSGIRHVLFFRDDTHLVSCADDRTLRVWDISSGKETQKLDFNTIPSSLEVSRDGTTLTVTHGNIVSFWDAFSLEKIREFPVLNYNPMTAAVLFVSFQSESFKGHFGPIHCVRFSPDGELYASGSEDGTLRLWQTTVGKTYGLWKCVDGAPLPAEPLSPPKQEVVAN
ncbi:unnamed protein product [Timema podura]|uniref:Serine-threonine kinase receptor-associated protein n=1 Tax=Timema podura TaxID=61482 RepID=A0ABN7P9G2_TIMPD|nr:unnamed protein product [Timema podura]